MKILPADPASPLYGPTGLAVDPVDGIEVDDFDPFWHRRIRDGEAVQAVAKPSPKSAPAKAD